ncbi:sec-independent protein translocase protein TatA [Halohasta litchfieldiae]|jgi:sec-independent protein translocase protein TatA|uniref:Sec-independent protein translocase protein TatA n=2 Tax=Halohasta litchfieldiae TaxID=1073996 RepID=A0A1H6WAR5_9EURY|nr:sec-independent protein translocase protein TatA [Halohasta litchfieldiae]SEJ14058.1 sec-independent protein translocase protein TatA [Halohasta litchfieldiae]
MVDMVTVLPLFGPVGPEMLIILLVLVLLFGANKIPKLARSTGQAMGEFKKGREDIEDELQEMSDPTADATSTTTDSEPVVEETEESDTETETEKAN